ncbi:hypothetical protein D3C71_1500030 [compost metagenome]
MRQCGAQRIDADIHIAGEHRVHGLRRTRVGDRRHVEVQDVLHLVHRQGQRPRGRDGGVVQASGLCSSKGSHIAQRLELQLRARHDHDG